MAKINLQQPKYMIPFILFPFLILGFFVFASFKSKSTSKAATAAADSIASLKTRGINADMPGVSKEVKDEQVKDKFAAYQEKFRNDKDFSALNNLEEPSSMVGKSGSTTSYNQYDLNTIQNGKRMDSIRKTIERRKALIEQRINSFSNPGGYDQSAGNNGTGKSHRNTAEADPFIEQLKKQAIMEQQANYPGHFPQSQPSAGKASLYDEQMKAFREQMRIVDSMKKGQGNQINGNIPTESKDANLKRFDPDRDTTFKPLHVTTNPEEGINNVRSGFNTLRKFSTQESIKAIIDETKKVTAGARIRIKLLQQIYVGDIALPEGSFIYGIVTGFQLQRINISITSINYNGRPVPVKLDVFDTDGYLGLFIPNSNFREFTKEVGNQSTQGLSNVQSANGSTSISTGMINKLFSSSSSTIGKLISQNKAIIKSDYIIYLQENQSSQKN